MNTEKSPKIEQEVVEAPLQINFSQFMTDRANKIRAEKGIQADVACPDIVQDGRAEIHPDLEGITFQFWVDKDIGVGVNFSGNAEKAPWAPNLTGKVFKDFTAAKGWLRVEAKRLSGN